MKPVVRELKTLCRSSQFVGQMNRYKTLREEFRSYFNGISDHARYFSTPASTEICGNHTVRNNGKVFAAVVDADIIAIAETFADNKVIIKIENLNEINIDLTDTGKRDSETGTAASLVRGILNAFEKKGLNVGGMRAYVSTSAVKSVGLSVAAPFEVLFGQILSALFNNGKVPLSVIAQMSYNAEKDYYGRVSDLTNQTACAVGGFVAIDFKDEKAPIIEEVPFSPESFGHSLCILNIGMTPLYDKEIRKIDDEMSAVARFFDCPSLRALSISDVILNISDLRRNFGDRAVLRSIHYFKENDRVERIIHALKNNNIEDFLSAVSESGNSSYKYLQNVYSSKDVRHQDMSIAFNTAEYALHKKGACRVCGDGFSGTVQAFVPHDQLIGFKMCMERTIGAGKCHALSLRNVGTCEVLL